MEIIGALKHAKCTRAFFYFRDADYINKKFPDGPTEVSVTYWSGQTFSKISKRQILGQIFRQMSRLILIQIWNPCWSVFLKSELYNDYRTWSGKLKCKISLIITVPSWLNAKNKVLHITVLQTNFPQSLYGNHVDMSLINASHHDYPYLMCITSGLLQQNLISRFSFRPRYFVAILVPTVSYYASKIS